MGFIVDVAGNKDVNEIDELVNNVYNIPYQRTPFSKLNIVASRQLKEIVRNNHYSIIHFHTPVASAFGRWAVKEFRKNGSKVVYTAHGFHFFKGAPLVNWLVFYPVERFLSHYTDMIITINKEDYARVRSFKAENVEYVPGVGVNISKFLKINVDKKAKRKELGIPEEAIVLLSVGELNVNKNHGVVIKAVANLNYPNIYYVVCGTGEREGYLKRLAISLGISDKVKLLGFRDDVSEIYKISNMFIFPSFREGLSVALMEAMASGLPVACSEIRGNSDLIENGKGGYLIQPGNVRGFEKAIESIIIHSNMSYHFAKENCNKMKSFESKNVLRHMKNIYNQLTNYDKLEDKYIRTTNEELNWH